MRLNNATYRYEYSRMTVMNSWTPVCYVWMSGGSTSDYYCANVRKSRANKVPLASGMFSRCYFRSKRWGFFESVVVEFSLAYIKDLGWKKDCMPHGAVLIQRRTAFCALVPKRLRSNWVRGSEKTWVILKHRIGGSVSYIRVLWSYWYFTPGDSVVTGTSTGTVEFQFEC